ncbi:MAG: acyl carrier protein, partial [Christensenellaceae bacterium]|nr:acyl carrier protein [Christensenellaceae bacterium]
GGDSLSAIGILAQIEEQYSIEINDDDFAKMTCVKEVAEKIYELTKK